MPAFKTETHLVIILGMVFSSLTFLYAYLPIVLAVCFLCPKKYRNGWILLASLFFYAWGEPIYILVMIASITVNWLFGNVISAADDKKAKTALILCLVFNLALLGFFKYWDFLAQNLHAIGLNFIRPLKLGLPIGISFYTFQTMSYPIDLYRGRTVRQKSLISFGAYVSMFPQLIAGPIVRYTDIAEQLDHRSVTRSGFAYGIDRFMVGLAKKVLLANQIGMVFEQISGLPAVQQTVLTAWLGILAFAFQIYFDFSGYSDMAIGLGKMMGFDFPENFNYPYTAVSLTDFWRRWHMTLSYWFRDYVYIPLGGNRRGLPRQILNIMIVWILTGFWHGASWNFVLWGLFYGILLIIEKVFLLKHLEKLPRWCAHLYTCVAVLLAWVLFAFPDMREGLHFFRLLFGGGHAFADRTTLFFLRDNLLILIACFIGSTPLAKNLWARHEKQLRPLMPVLVIAALVICTAFIVDASYNPFLYFRF